MATYGAGLKIQSSFSITTFGTTSFTVPANQYALFACSATGSGTVSGQLGSVIVSYLSSAGNAQNCVAPAGTVITVVTSATAIGVCFSN